MRVAYLVVASCVFLLAMPAAAAELLISRGQAAADSDPISLTGRDGRVQISAREVGDVIKVDIDILSATSERSMKAGITLSDGQQFAIRLPSVSRRTGETLTVKRVGDAFRAVLTRPTAIRAMRTGPAALAKVTMPEALPAEFSPLR